MASALRESEEELDLPAGHVEVLGALKPEYSLGNKARVWPIIVSWASESEMLGVLLSEEGMWKILDGCWSGSIRASRSGCIAPGCSDSCTMVALLSHHPPR